MSTISKNRPSGFSLIELLIGVAVLFALMALAAPSYRVWLQNEEIRNAAESVQNGLQLARAQAIFLNRNVEFVLSATDDNCKYTLECSSWEVKAVGGATIEKRGSKEGSVDITRLATPKNATTVIFNNVGGRVASASDITDVTFGSGLLAPADNHLLRVVIGVGGVGGTVRMCDPSITSGPRAC